MRRILATAAALCLGGCITVYGPVKTGGQQQQDSQAGQQPGMSEQISISFIGNRKPDELLNAVALYFREKAITVSVNDQTTGIIAGKRNAEQQRSLDHRKFLLLSADKVQRDFAEALGCAGDNESIMEAIDDLKQHIAELESKNSNLRTIAHEQNELAIRANLDSINDAVEMDRLHKRIAELEAREISLPERSSMLYRTDFHEDCRVNT
ncbi:TPA: hypothetical protein ACIVXL_001585 [Salmonella enterica subsp. houtenae serovar 1,40:z4,z23:-]